MRAVARVLGSLAIAWLLAGPVVAQVRVPQLVAHTAPGGTFVLTGDNLTDKGVVVTLDRDGKSNAIKTGQIEAAKATFEVPKELAPGDYLVMVKHADALPVYTATLVVTAPPAPPQTETAPKILRTIPTSSMWKLWRWGQYDFDVAGERLNVPKPKSEISAVTLRLGDQPIELAACDAPPKDKKLTDEYQTKPCYAVPAGEEGRTVSVHGISTWDHGGPHKVSLVTPAGQSKDDVTLRISRITPRMIKWLSLAFVGALIGLFVWLGKDAFATAAGGERHRFIGWVLLDQQTNTFSLSKVQFLLWLFTIAYGYVLLQLALVFAQGNTHDMAPFPDGFGWLLGLSGGTSLTSIMLTRARGAKGAGDSGPAFSDLVSTGGILAPDRAQLLLWTVIGCSSYLLLILRTPVEALTTLPPVDMGMLGAMGISAAVYAGGKSVRLPGPVINQVAVAAAANQLVIKGQNLHKNAIISLDRQPAEATIAGTPTPGPASDSLSAELKVTITPLPFTTGDHLLRVTNLDGQYADAWFAADPPAITKVAVGAGAADQVPAGANETVLTLTGTAFRVGSTAEWTPAEQTSPTIITAADVTVTSETAATVKVKPGLKKGGSTITLVSPHDIRASRVVTIQ